ncbi:sodium channel subunit beta-1-like, partial [Neopelma chrysocephalum]|uniref:sodium channel subunit beta-1-like n=1 Tax=Neopelma chrysocephalum TaxID=114329 RepID=UPI000FCCF9CE
FYWFRTGFYWFLPVQILHYSPDEGPTVFPGPFQGTLSWNGSKNTRDLQDLSVMLEPVTRDHAGSYVCRLRRNLTFEGYTYSLARNQTLRLAVVEKGGGDWEGTGRDWEQVGASWSKAQQSGGEWKEVGAT